MYLNLTRNEPAVPNISSQNMLSEELADLTVPYEWEVVQDKPECISIVRPEKWEFNNQRVITELVVSKPQNSASTFISIRAHGC